MLVIPVDVVILPCACHQRAYFVLKIIKNLNLKLK